MPTPGLRRAATIDPDLTSSSAKKLPVDGALPSISRNDSANPDIRPAAIAFANEIGHRRGAARPARGGVSRLPRIGDKVANR